MLLGQSVRRTAGQWGRRASLCAAPAMHGGRKESPCGWQSSGSLAGSSAAVSGPSPFSAPLPSPSDMGSAMARRLQWAATSSQSVILLEGNSRRTLSAFSTLICEDEDDDGG